MKTNHLPKVFTAITLLFAVIACNKNTDFLNKQTNHPAAVTEEMMSEKGANPDEASVAEFSPGTDAALNTAARGAKSAHHYLYTESNDAKKNAIVIYEIKSDGSLHLNGTTSSERAGTGIALGSQGAVVLDKNHEWLYAVNAGNNSVSSYKVHEDGSLTLVYSLNTGGKIPVSVTVHDDVLYVLNRGSDNIHGFKIGSYGHFVHIEGSTKSLSGIAVDAPQISFTPDGNWVIVTEKATNMISTFKVKDDGSVNAGIFTPSVGNTPFGFDFSRGKFMIVSDAAGGAAGAGLATSYVIGDNGKPNDINGAVPDYQAAPCWVAVTKYGRYAYTTNTASNNISSYFIPSWGGLYLVQNQAAKTGMGPLDIVVAANNYYVYELNKISNTIGGYHRKYFGALEAMGESAVPAGATGLATY